ISGDTRLGSIGLISRRAFLVTMLSSMFCVTRVSPRSKKMALAGRAMGVPGPGRVFHGIRLVAGPHTCRLRLPRGLSRRAVLCRGSQLLLRFFDEGSSQLKLNRANLARQGAESAVRLFSTWCSSTCRSTRKLRDLKSPAPIPDQGLFRVIFKARISKKYGGHFLSRHTPGGSRNS